MKKLVIVCLLFLVACQANPEEPTFSHLPTEGDYTFYRYVEDKKQSEYRMLYSVVPNSNIVQSKLVQTLEDNEVIETNTFYTELEDGVYGYYVLEEQFPDERTAEDVERFPKQKILSLPPAVGDSWTNSIEELGNETIYTNNFYLRNSKY